MATKCIVFFILIYTSWVETITQIQLSSNTTILKQRQFTGYYTLQDVAKAYNLPPLNHSKPIGHVHIPKIRYGQCIQIVYSSWIAPAYCSLPPYCQQVKYVTVDGATWFKDVGLCIGIQTSPMKIKVSTDTGTQHALIFDEDWYEIHEITLPTQFDDIGVRIVPYFKNNVRLLRNEHRHGFIAKDMIENYVQYNGELIPPKLHNTEDGSFCILEHNNKNFPHYMFFNTLHDLIHYINIPTEPSISVARHKHKSGSMTISYIAVGTWTSPEQYDLHLDNVLQFTTCDHHIQTMTALPLHLNALPQTIGNVIFILISQIFHWIFWLASRASSKILSFFYSSGIHVHLSLFTYVQYKFNNIYLSIIVFVATLAILPISSYAYA